MISGRRIQNWTIECIGDAPPVVLDEGGNAIATVHQTRGGAELSRAALIASAPGMYDALVGALEVFRVIAQHADKEASLAAQDMIPVLEWAIDGANCMGPVTPDLFACASADFFAQDDEFGTPGGDPGDLLTRDSELTSAADKPAAGESAACTSYPHVTAFMHRFLDGMVKGYADVFLVLDEDNYETSFGDGEYLYLHDTFLEDECQAAACIAQGKDGYTLHQRRARIHLEGGYLTLSCFERGFSDRWRHEQVFAALEALLEIATDSAPSGH